MSTGALPGASLWGQGLFGGAAGTITTGLSASDIIYAGYRIAGILGAPGRGYSPEEVVDGLLVLNSIIDAWNAEQLNVYAIQRRVFALVDAKQDYTIGSGADFDTPRPPRIEVAGVVLALNPVFERTVKVLTTAQWQSIAVKGFADTLPRTIYYDRGIAAGSSIWPTGTISVWPVPSGTPQLALYLWQTLGLFENSSDPVLLPYGYRHALEYALGVELAARFQVRANLQPNAPEVAKIGRDMIRQMNATLFDGAGQ